MPNFGKANALKQELTPSLVWIALFSCTGAFTFGFDNGWWGGVIGNPYFNLIFGDPVTGPDGKVSHALSAVQQSTGTAAGTAGIAVGCMIAGYISKRFGRKFSFYATAIGSVLGVIIQITAGVNGARYWQIVGGKIVICISIGIASVSVPLYLAECSPAAIRGALVNSYVEVQAVGGFISSIVIFCVKDFVDKRVWCIPIGLQLLAPVIMLCFGWTIPESPRWLLESGRQDEARKALLHLRRGKAGYNPDEDIRALEENYAREVANGSVTWAQCFRGVDLKRTLIVLGVQCLQQGQGISFMANYLVIFFMQLGIQDPYMILVIIGAILICLTAAGFFVQDFLGRRTLLIWGGSVMAGSLIAVGGITTITPSPTGARANGAVFLSECSRQECKLIRV
jgi:sugar porter (SP) family MFS transporter